MCKRRKGAVLSAAAEYLRGEGQEQGAFRVVVEGEGESHHWQGRVESAARAVQPPGGPAEGALWLSPFAEEVLAAVPGDGAWITTARIEEALRGSLHSVAADLSSLLRDLVARQILDRHQRFGFRRRDTRAVRAG